MLHVSHPLAFPVLRLAKPKGDLNPQGLGAQGPDLLAEVAGLFAI